MKTKKLLLLLLSIAVTVGCSSDAVKTATKGATTIKGKVTNKTTGAAVAGAKVVTDPATTTATTSATGEYTISAIADGKYTLKATATDYTDYTGPSFTAISAGGTITLTKNIEMVPGTTSGGDGDGSSSTIKLPLDFESITATVQSFSQANAGNDPTTTANIIDNPYKSGINTSNKVVEVIDPSGSAWSGAWINLTEKIDFSTKKSLKIKVYASKLATVKIKLESVVDGESVNSSSEISGSNAASSTWEEIEFNFSAIDTGIEWNRVTFVTPGNGDDTKYYFDDVTQAVSSQTIVIGDLPLTFEDAGTDYDANGGEFGGGHYDVADNPSTAGNASTKVGKYTKNAGEVYGGIVYTLPKDIDFTSKNGLKLKFYAPKAGDKILVKVENGANSGVNAEATVTITAANTWEEHEVFLSLDASQTYKKLILIANNGTMGAGEVYYFDDVEAANVTAPAPAAAPTDAPATPTQAAGGVTSLYSDAYTDIPSNTNPGWSEVVTDETIAGNNVKKTTNFLPFDGANVDLSTRTMMHVDFWLPALPTSGAGLLIKLVATNAPTGEGNYTHPVASMTAGSWNSIDIPLSSFTQVSGTFNGTQMINQVLIDIVDDTDMYVDNVYFY